MKISISSKRSTIINLKPDSVITLFHGTNQKNAVDMCVNGIDARKSTYQLYPHYVNNGQEKRMVSRGLFVTHDLKIAKSFGNNILKFRNIGKKLDVYFPIT